jgi:S1-C subfamily serine protease
MGWLWGILIVFSLYASTALGLGIYDEINRTSPLQAYVIIEDASGHGSGVFISPTQVLTAKHVTEHVDDKMRVRGPDGDLYKIIGVYDGPADISIIEVDRPLRGTPLEVSCVALERGDKLSYYGSPGSLEFIGPVDVAYIGGKLEWDEDPDYREMVGSTLLVNGEAEPGVSGSGVLDSQGRVVGVYNFAWTGTTFGGFVSLSYPQVCSWVLEELQLGAHA